MSGDAAGLIENKASGLDPWPVLMAEISMFLVFATTSKAKMMKRIANGLIRIERDVDNNKNVVAKSIAQATDTYNSPTRFCVMILWMIQTTSPQSKLVGRAQGLYELACQHQLAITVSMSFVFVDGPNNGSCISLFGNNWQIVHVRKMPIIGATHVFLLTCGYAIAQTHRADFKSGDVIVGCNVSDHIPMHYTLIDKLLVLQNGKKK
ncbi:hypothetical protein CUMW_217490 [Citrus unshiu]|uniref:Dirigent protein n=2 Tax=Citrus TaxID=2706 RepID=A0A2H5QCT4_CITUN|nr:hypothetical protein CUMW_217490 [Citrus unshiu]